MAWQSRLPGFPLALSASAGVFLFSSPNSPVSKFVDSVSQEGFLFSASGSPASLPAILLPGQLPVFRSLCPGFPVHQARFPGLHPFFRCGLQFFRFSDYVSQEGSVLQLGFQVSPWPSLRLGGVLFHVSGFQILPLGLLRFPEGSGPRFPFPGFTPWRSSFSRWFCSASPASGFPLVPFRLGRGFLFLDSGFQVSPWPSSVPRLFRFPARSFRLPGFPVHRISPTVVRFISCSPVTFAYVIRSCRWIPPSNTLSSTFGPSPTALAVIAYVLPALQPGFPGIGSGCMSTSPSLSEERAGIMDEKDGHFVVPEGTTHVLLFRIIRR